MAHPQQQAFVATVKAAFPGFFTGGRVLEIGSLDINGSARAHFNAREYIGLDVGSGPGVDVVCQGQDYDAPDGTFDVVLSCETMEHNPHWGPTFANMVRLARPGGMVLMTCATSGRREHGTKRTSPKDAPLIEWDYYGNRTAEDFRRVVDLRRLVTASMFCSDLSFCDLFFVGFRTGAAAPPGAQAKLNAIRRNYWRANLRNWPALRRNLLIGLVGEQRYWAGSLRPWKHAPAEPS
jgi:SAM-dependent methyltransferase